MLGGVQQCLASRQNPTWGRKRSREAFNMRIDSREGVPVSSLRQMRPGQREWG